MTRRELLKAGMVATLTVASGGLAGFPTVARAATLPNRTLWVYRVQTKEEGRVVYFQDDDIIPDGYTLLCYLLRDVRAEQVIAMDLTLIHLLFGIQAWLQTCGIQRPLRITSGYRTPETNAHTEGAAAHSQHRSGQAADVSVEGIPTAILAKLAGMFQAGGVGTYPSFVHIDTGPVRVWTG